MPYKQCKKCLTTQPLELYRKRKYKNGTEYLYSQCTPCERAQTKKHQETNREYWREVNRKSYARWTEEAYNNHYERTLLRHKHIKERIPLWADKDLISAFYRNRPEGYHVDHIIPLRGDIVCGLHVETNLQYLPAHENLSKGNQYAVYAEGPEDREISEGLQT